MTRKTKWQVLMAATALVPLLGWSGCSTDFRDALQGGVLDFISGTITALLSSLLPVAEAATAA